MCGAKLTIDGSPQGFTAWRDRPYYDPVGDYPPGYSGYASATREQVLDSVAWAFENNIQLLTHANGEDATDLLIAAIDAAQKVYGTGDRRPVLIHGQFLREDQVDSYKRLGVLPSLFPMHTFYWGDWHRDHTLGPKLADNISPTGWGSTSASVRVGRCVKMSIGDLAFCKVSYGPWVSTVNFIWWEEERHGRRSTGASGRKARLLRQLAEIQVEEQRRAGRFDRVPHYSVLEESAHGLGQELSRLLREYLDALCFVRVGEDRVVDIDS